MKRRADFGGNNCLTVVEICIYECIIYVFSVHFIHFGFFIKVETVTKLYIFMKVILMLL